MLGFYCLLFLFFSKIFVFFKKKFLFFFKKFFCVFFHVKVQGFQNFMVLILVLYCSPPLPLRFDSMQSELLRASHLPGISRSRPVQRGILHQQERHGGGGAHLGSESECREKGPCPLSLWL